MKTRTLFILSLALSIAGSAFLNAAKVGEPAPAFTLSDLSGTEHKLSDFAGKFVVLEWVNPDCPFVKKHYGSGNMQALQKTWTDKGVVWLSIESTKASHPQYYGKAELTKFTKKAETHSSAFLLDEGGKVGKLYDARTTPHMYVISPEGELIYNGAIDSISSANPKDIEKAENYVVAALTAAKAGDEVSKKSTRPYGCSVKY
ncbi:MAG: redoxin domain-containing protein [Opitutales bacterium]